MGRFFFLALGLLVVAFSLNGIGADHHCPMGWFSLKQFCYKFFKEAKTWQEAETFCVQQQKGSHLVSIQSWRESRYVAKLASIKLLLSLNGSMVWTGLYDEEKNGNWTWSDGSDFRYTAWQIWRPNNGDDKQFCVALDKGFGESQVGGRSLPRPPLLIHRTRLSRE
ncbi:C-type lectin lectoxin-Lei1-like [Erythrolamprus reginae]|uniref:C-type lectin lectoxin-Lei1-like n=1 Tax=Erythrolamprus reginae TaxID=121349 RepID=UPI00396C6A8F